MFKNYAHEKTPETNSKWKNMLEGERAEKIEEILKKKTEFSDFKVFKASDNGEVVFKVEKSIPLNKRSPILLDLEEDLKSQIDKGLTVWFEPVGDKSKLRNLRGIKFK